MASMKQGIRTSASIGTLRNRPVRELRLFGLLFGAPVDEVAGVEGDAEKVGGNETELCSADANDANDGAIEGGNDPALPEFLANQDGGENGQHDGEIIAPDDVEYTLSIVGKMLGRRARES